MMVVRLRVSEPLGSSDWIHHRLPVRIGRHPEDDCQVLLSTSVPFHLELDWADERLILRVLGQSGVILVRIAGEMRELHGCELTTSAHEIEFAVGGVWVRASIEERALHRLIEAAEGAIDELLRDSARAAMRDDVTAARMVLAALVRGAVRVRAALAAAHDESTSPGSEYNDVTDALVRWAQAAIAATHLVAERVGGDERALIDSVK
jgi:hypothetical protein